MGAGTGALIGSIFPGIGTALGALIGAGVGGAGGGMLGGMFDKPEIPHEVRETLETARHGQQVTTFLQSLSRVDSPQALYDRLARAASGPQQSIIVGAKLPPNDPGLVWS